MAELQKDPITRGDFLGFGVLGTIMGAIITVPAVAFVLDPIIKVDLLGQSNVPDDWFEVGPIRDVTAEEPAVFRVEFPVNQTYSQKIEAETEGEPPEIPEGQFTVPNAVWVSWKHEVTQEGSQGSDGDTLGEAQRPAFLDELGEGDTLTAAQVEEATDKLNVLASSCAHLGCPVRWEVQEGEGLFLCPCHGGLYDINGGYVGGPPPRGLYRYTFEVREDGLIYVRHEFDIEPGLNSQEPYVI